MSFISKKFLLVLLTLLVFSMISPVAAGTTWFVDDDSGSDFTTIQDAVNASSPGDTIIVRDGTYNENVDVGKSITLKSENGAASTTVVASNPDDHVFEVTADYVNISGFTVRGPTLGAGVFLTTVENCNISNIDATNNNVGIALFSSSDNTLTGNMMFDNNYTLFVHGFSLPNFINKIDTTNKVDGKPVYYWVDRHDQKIPDDAGYVGVVNSTNITVEDLTLEGNGQGILFAYTSNSKIVNVNVSNNFNGIDLASSSNNILTNNNASDNEGGFTLISSSNNTLTGNTASNKRVGIGLAYSSNNTLMGNTLNSNYQSGIVLYISSYNTLTGNNAEGNGIGITLENLSNYNTLTSNNASGNNHGIWLHSSSDNKLTNNTASSNLFGIYLVERSSDNLIYNNYFDNTNNAEDDGNNIWNITKTLGTNIIGGPYLGGNYWSDYAGVDNDTDGLGDTLLPYNSSGNIITGGDYHPLVEVLTPTPTPTIPPDEEIPEFPTIAIPAAMILGLVFIMQRRRKNE
ncbi:MAG: NosD domain-containing protein [Halobacteriota archaeon]|nr:NosD domain-containing protein [Halobacteriota archaeon]